MAKNTPTVDEAFQDVVTEEVDTDFVAWMASHEDSVRKSWVYDEVWADMHNPMLPNIIIVKGGIVTEELYMSNFLGKWEKKKSGTNASWVGYGWDSVHPSEPNYQFVARRAFNTMTKETLFYAK